MANNIQDWKSTAIGGILFIIGTLIMVLEYLTFETVEWNHYIFPGVLTTAGIGFVLAPNRLIDFLFSWAKKKVDK
jgi:hypothetical protein